MSTWGCLDLLVALKEDIERRKSHGKEKSGGTQETVAKESKRIPGTQLEGDGG